MFQPMFMVPGDPRTVEQAAAIEVLKIRDLASEDMTYGYVPFAAPTGERRVLLAMARPAVLDETMDLVRQVGLELADIVPAPAAMLQALATDAETADGASVFAQVGHSVTELAIGSPSGLMFARSFGAGGQLFTDALARTRQLPGPHAENAKVKGDCALREGDSAEEKALLQAADAWVAEFQSCVTVYKSLFHDPKDRLTRLVLSGGGALLTGFAEYVGAKTGLQTRVAERLAMEGAPEPAAVWAIAGGLAAGALKPQQAGISLVPRAVRDEWIFRRQKPFWIAAGLTAGLILAVGLAGGWYDSRRMERLLREQRMSLERRKNLVAQIEGMKVRNEQIRSLAAPVAGLLRAAPQMRKLIALVAQAKGANDWITLISDADSYYAKKAAVPGGRATEGEGVERRRQAPVISVDEAGTNSAAGLGHIIIEGYTPMQNFSTVQKMLDRLEASDLIETADLLSDDKLANPEPPSDSSESKAKRFVIDVKVSAR
jgi:cell division ATPase FtsA